MAANVERNKRGIFGEGDSLSQGYNYEPPQQYHQEQPQQYHQEQPQHYHQEQPQHHHEHVRTVEVPVPQPYPVEKIVEKVVHVPQPYPVEKIVEKVVHVPKPYPVEKIVQQVWNTIVGFLLLKHTHFSFLQLSAIPSYQGSCEAHRPPYSSSNIP